LRFDRKEDMFTSFPVIEGRRRGEARAFPHLADGGRWKTLILQANLGTSDTESTLRLWRGEAGAPYFLPLAGVPELKSDITRPIPVGGIAIAETAGTAAADSAGWAQVSTRGRIGGLAVFQDVAKLPKTKLPDSEATVPMLIPAERGFALPFDNENGYVTGVALVNPDLQSAVTVQVTFRDASGKPIPNSENIAIGSLGHTAFALPDRFPQTRNMKGVAEFRVPGRPVAGLGLRFSPFAVFTALPTIPLE
jgi:hypothetical protein